jgi:hypothetical protein
MKKTQKEILQLIRSEIRWCKENPDNDLSADFQKGFIKGLRQAILLINATA